MRKENFFNHVRSSPFEAPPSTVTIDLWSTRRTSPLRFFFPPQRYQVFPFPRQHSFTLSDGRFGLPFLAIRPDSFFLLLAGCRPPLLAIYKIRDLPFFSEWTQEGNPFLPIQARGPFPFDISSHFSCRRQ